MDKYIFKKDSALTSDQCNSYIEYMESSNNTIDDKLRGYKALGAALEVDTFTDLRMVLNLNVQEYVEQHLILSRIYTNWSVDNVFNIQKYEPNYAYDGEHMEHGKDRRSSVRLLGWMVYLNTINYKGGTIWPQQNFISTPKKGDLYIWPSGWTHSHYGIAAPEETKYILTGWCSFVGVNDTFAVDKSTGKVTYA